MLKELWNSLSSPAKMILGLTAAEVTLAVLSNSNQQNNNRQTSSTPDPRKQRLRNSVCYSDPMVAFHNLTPENQQKVLAWAKQNNLTIEEVIRSIIDR